MPPAVGTKRRVIGRYVLCDEIASGGMAAVHLGRLVGPVGFSRTVAIKRLHAPFARDPEFVSMFLDEARLAARISHPNVVSTVDVVATDGELFLVMDYVQGESLSRLVRALLPLGQRIPPKVALSIMCDALYGLHAAHEAKDENGEALGIVHRDVSPHNIMVAKDGVARVLDFGIAKAASRAGSTREGELKGKLSYMSPEQLRHEPVDRRTDVFAASIVLWEILTGERLFRGDDAGAIVMRVLGDSIRPPSERFSEISPQLDAIVLRGLARDPARRFATAHAMATELEAQGPARPAQVAEWVEGIAKDVLAERSLRVAEIESESESGAVRREMPTEILQEPAVDSSADSPPTVRPMAPLPSRSRRRSLGAVLALAVLALIGTISFVRWGTRSKQIEKVGTPTPLAPLPPSASQAHVQAPLPSAETVRSAPAVQPAVGRSAEKPSMPPRPRARCDPPFFFDEEGVKRFKPGCV